MAGYRCRATRGTPLTYGCKHLGVRGVVIGGGQREIIIPDPARWGFYTFFGGCYPRQKVGEPCQGPFVWDHIALTSNQFPVTHLSI